MVSKLNLYDPLTLLAWTPGASELLFAPAAVATSSKEAVNLIGENEIRDPELVKNLLAGLGIAALRRSSLDGRR